MDQVRSGFPTGQGCAFAGLANGKSAQMTDQIPGHGEVLAKLASPVVSGNKNFVPLHLTIKLEKRR
ncbi:MULTISPECIES: hypothetical protein [unclassified Bradyrhizobium]|uniref:hypothetical protein n=1 Tax=unclassified Bradyrhizobium TaxID=2631580 RepID=UPI00291623AA|nr:MULTISPECIES: hypothetical protein [unclassified Bradyrhizobium]